MLRFDPPSFQEYPLNTDAAGTAPPDAFGPFRVLHQIGAGALGPVFRAYQPEQDRLVAVKLFRLDIPPERTHQLVAQLEGLIAADLTHPGIAAPLATGLSDVSAYLAMDFVAADSLDIVIRDQQLSTPAEAVRVASQIASALDLAAAIDITHGALHPRDVLVSADDVRITGIGIARALETLGASAPIRRPYTAPERAAGAAWDRRADVFSLAALIFELLTRRRIAGPGDQPSDALASVTGVDGTALSAVFDRALAERTSDRFPTAGDFAKAMQAAVEKKRAGAGRVGASIRTPVPAPIAAAPPTSPLTAEELPLFTDSMLGTESATPSAADATPPPIVDAAHEALAPDLSFRDAPLSMVESLHEPAAGTNALVHVIDDFTSAPHESHGRRMTIDDVHPPAHQTAPPVSVPPVKVRPHRREPASEPPLKRRDPDFDIAEVIAQDVAEPASRPAPFESLESDARTSSGVWPLMLALVVGIALGFGMAMLLLGRDRVPPAQAASAAAPTGRGATEVRDEPIREITGQTVATSPKPAAAEPSAAKTDAAKPDAAKAETPPAATMTSVAASSANTARRSSVEKPPSAPAPKTPPRRVDAPVANTPAAKPQSKAVLTPLRNTPAPRAATPTKSQANSARTSSAVAKTATAAGRGAASKPVPAAPAKAAPQTPVKPEAGSLAVDSRPPGASVYIDGRRVGATPLVLDTLKVGQYTIGIDLDGYQRWATTVKVAAGERSRVAASLER